LQLHKNTLLEYCEIRNKDEQSQKNIDSNPSQDSDSAAKPVSIVRFRYSFICQGISTMRQRRDLCGLQVKLLPVPVTTSLTAQR